MATDDPALINYEKLIAGHNLTAEAIIGFYKSTASLEKSSKKSLNVEEAQFQKEFLSSNKITRLGKDFYVIAVSVQNTETTKELIGHEIYHAQYELNPKFRKTVDLFWNGIVNQKDKRKAADVLGKMYNTSDRILIDEFQAYILEDGAESGPLLKLAVKYKPKLQAALKKAGASLIMIE